MSDIIHNNKLLTEKVCDEIIKIIIDSNLNIGARLPNEYDLAERLGVGRSTLREAIKSLTSRNILEIRRGSGTFVSQKLGVSDDPLGLMFFKDKHRLALDLLQIRFMIEPQIASLAAQNATDEDIKELTALCDEIEHLILSGKNYVDKDVEYHTKIASCSKNLVMPNLIPIINTAIALFIDITKKVLKNETIETHRDILNAIKNHDSASAEYAMLLHLMYNRRNIEKLNK